jgi:uncharacterized integral membrane protein
MLRRLLGWLVVLPFAAIVVALAVANRSPVTLAWNPAQAGMPGHGVTLPLFVFAFAVFLLGALAGGFVVWNAQRRWRRDARDNRREVRDLQGQVQRLRSERAGSDVAVLAGPR